MIFALLLILGLGAFAWIAFCYPRVALPLFLALLPTYLIRFSIGPLPTTFLEVIFWMLFGGWFIHGVTDGTDTNGLDGFLRYVWRMACRPRTLIVALLFFLVSFTSLAVVPREHLVSSLGLWRAYLLEPFLFGLMLFEILRSTGKLPQDDTDAGCRVVARHDEKLFLSLVLSAFILAALGIFQYTTRLGIPAPWDIEGRITSVFDYPNALGLFLAPILSALLVFGVSTWKKRARHEKMFVVGASVTMLLGIILAKTEAALVAIPDALFVAFLASPLSQKKQKIAALVLGAAVFVGMLFVAPVREKIFLQDFSGEVRRSQWRETLQLLADHPIAGAGFGYYPEMLRAYHADWQYEIFQYPHNILLNTWVELGILGVILGGGALFYLAKNVWEKRHDPLVLAAGAALFTMCIHGLVDVPFFKNDLAMMTAFFVSLILASHEDGC